MPWRPPYYNNTGVQALAQSVGQFSDALARLGELRQREQDQQGLDEAFRLSADVYGQVEALGQAARLPADDSELGKYGVPDGEVTSQTYVERFTKGLDALESEVTKLATGPRTPVHLKRVMTRLRGEALASAQKVKGQLFRQEITAEVADVLDRHVTTAINEPDDERAKLILGEAEFYLSQKMEVLEGLVGADAVGQLRRKARDEVSFGRAAKKVDADPEQDVTPLLEKLPVERWDDLRRYQAQARVRADRDLAVSQAARDAALKAHREDAERYIVNALDADTLTPDDLDLYGPYLSSERLEAFRKALRAQQVGGGPGDPGVIREFRASVYAVDLDTAEEVGQVSRALARAYNAKLVPDGDFKDMSAHLQALADRFQQRTERATARTEDRAERERERQATERARLAESVYSEVRGTIRDTLKVASEFGPDFNVEAEEVRTLALEELARQTGRGRTEDAGVWWERNRARFISQIDTRASTRIRLLRQSMSGRVPALVQAEPLSEEYRAALVTLKASRAAFPSEEAWHEEVRRAREVWALRAEQERLRVLQGLIRPREDKAQ